MTYYVYRYMWLIENLNDLTQTYQKTVVSIGRVNEILENYCLENDNFKKIFKDELIKLVDKIH